MVFSQKEQNTFKESRDSFIDKTSLNEDCANDDADDASSSETEVKRTDFERRSIVSKENGAVGTRSGREIMRLNKPIEVMN